MSLVLPPSGTLLVISPLSGATAPTLTPYSARNLSQTWELLKGNWTKRDVNGVKRSVADTRFRKYRSTITCTDVQTPALDNAWIGTECEVSCAFEFVYPVGGSPERPVVSGSSRLDDGGAYVFYRPLLLMMIEDIRDRFDEWGARHGWEIQLEEI
jgi:hypothetical protein